MLVEWIWDDDGDDEENDDDDDFDDADDDGVRPTELNVIDVIQSLNLSIFSLYTSVVYFLL